MSRHKANALRLKPGKPSTGDEAMVMVLAAAMRKSARLRPTPPEFVIQLHACEALASRKPQHCLSFP